MYENHDKFLFNSKYNVSPTATELSDNNAMEKQTHTSTGTITKGTVTVDAVHPRLLNKSKFPQKLRSTPSDQVSYCTQCNEHIGITVDALRNHFGRSRHESQPCVYCHGPVYKYVFRYEQNFHECISDVTRGQESSYSDTSSLSEIQVSDVSETQSISRYQGTENFETTSLVYVQNSTESGSLTITSNDEDM